MLWFGIALISFGLVSVDYRGRQIPVVVSTAKKHR